MTVDNHIQISALYQGWAGIQMNSYHYAAPDPGPYLYDYLERAASAWFAKAEQAQVTRIRETDSFLTEIRAIDRSAVDGGGAVVYASLAGTANEDARLPPQLTPVVSLISGHPGRSGQGRVYLPYTAFFCTVGGDAIWDSSTGMMTTEGTEACTAAVTPFGAFTTTDGTFDLQVYSRLQDALYSAFVVRCGSAVDTQRRRRDQLIEVYTSEGI